MICPHCKGEIEVGFMQYKGTFSCLIGWGSDGWLPDAPPDNVVTHADDPWSHDCVQHGENELLDITCPRCGGSLANHVVYEGKITARDKHKEVKK